MSELPTSFGSGHRNFRHDSLIHSGNSDEAVEEKISLSDRFGLWLSFYPFNQDAYIEVVKHWLGVFGKAHGVSVDWDQTVRDASLRWALARGVRSGRTAQHFARHWTGGLLIARGESDNG